MVHLHYIDVILLISACQCLFVSVFIIRKYGNTIANKVLSALFISYTLVLTEMILWDVKLFTIFPRFMILLVGTVFLVGPLQYLYTLYLSHLRKRFSLKDTLHFIPFLLFEIAMFPFLFVPDEELIGALNSGTDDIPVSSLALNWIIMLQIFIYSVLIFFAVKKYSNRIKNIFSTIDKVKLGWLRNSAVIFSLSIVLYIAETMLNIGGMIGHDYQFTSVAAGVFMYYMAYLVMIKSEVFASREFSEVIESNIVPEDKTAGVSEDSPSQPKYEKSGLSDDKAKEYVARLIKIMEDEKPYLNSELTLNKLAEKVSVPSHHLSEVINVQLNQNFFDFINKYRVEKVKEDLADPAKANYTLLAIGVEAGFNSKSAFNLVFKKQTGMTPSEYKRTLKQ